MSGLILAYYGPRVIRARSRFWAFAFWDLSTFLLNGSLFVLVGMQVPHAVGDIDGRTVRHALAVALTASAVAILTRLVWVHLITWVIRLVDRRAVQRTGARTGRPARHRAGPVSGAPCRWRPRSPSPRRWPTVRRMRSAT